MPTRAHINALARELRLQMEGQPFISMPRRSITDLLRVLSGEPNTRIKSQMAVDIRDALLHCGVRVYPPLEWSDTNDILRLFPAGGTLAALFDVLDHVDDDSNKEVTAIIDQIEGRWEYATRVGPALAATPMGRPEKKKDDA